MTYPKLDCECKHTFVEHNNDTFDARCNKCACDNYDPAGHNPELYNILCPRCRKVRLEKPYPKTYMCLVCNYVMFEKQIEELLG